VILARGLGTRLRARSETEELTPEQETVAAAGVKALMPIDGRRVMLDLIVENLNAAGFDRLCLVIGDEHSAIREHCARRGYGARFAVQKKPLGTADAVLAAAAEVGSEELFAVVNSDNLYPVASLSELRRANRPALVGFSRNGLITRSNIAPERIAKFATIECDAAMHLAKIIEKPTEIDSDALVSMNAWLFSPYIFEACRGIPLSPRGEFEITAAVQYAVDVMKIEFRVVRSDEGVLDLSSRADVGSVKRFLGGAGR